MPRIAVPDTTHATADARSPFDAVGAKIGKVANLFGVMDRIPATRSFSAANAADSISAAEREQLPAAVARCNGCGDHLSAHSVMGKSACLTDGGILEVALAGLNTCSNYVNHVAGTAADLPNVDPAPAS
jgi:AhpD family alkylhydroperoxidase